MQTDTIENILVVDDEEAIREVVSTMLESKGYRCTAVSRAWGWACAVAPRCRGGSACAAEQRSVCGGAAGRMRRSGARRTVRRRRFSHCGIICAGG